MQKEIQKIGKVLIGEGILTREEVASAIRGGSLKGSTIADLLEKCHHVSSAELAAFLASDFEIPVIRDLRKFDLPDGIAKVLPKPLALKYGILPLIQMGDILCVARADYSEASGIEEVRKETGLRLKVFRAEKAQLEVALERLYGQSKRLIPAPKKVLDDDTAVLSPPTRASQGGGIPLISSPRKKREMDPEEEVLLVEDSTPEPGSSGKVLSPLVVAPHEFGAAQKDHGANMIRIFEETFLEDITLSAQPLI